MAMSNVKLEDFLKEDVDLESVKQLIEKQEIKYGLKKCDTPLLQFPILDFSERYQWESDLIVIRNNVYVGQLVARASDNEWIFTLRLECVLEDVDTFPPLQRFRCKLISYDVFPNPIVTENVISLNLFIRDARINKIHFHMKSCASRNATVEIYEEPANFGNYVSPLKNAVVGKIEAFREKLKFAFENNFLVECPRFEFGLAGQKMMVSFGHAKENVWGINSVWATLVVQEKEARVRASFALKVSFTIFNQRGNGSDFVKKVVLPIVENEQEYPIFLAFNKYLETLGCLENDTLYYMVVAEPFTFKLNDETAKNSK